VFVCFFIHVCFFVFSAGKGLIYGLDVESQLNQLQQILGVCPQHGKPKKEKHE